jgi:TonB family protein
VGGEPNSTMNLPLNFLSTVSHARLGSSIVLLITLAGCAHAPLRHVTSELDIVSAADVPAGVTAPIPIHTVAPEYPYWARWLGIDGWANVYCLVDESGAVRDAAILNESDTGIASGVLAAVNQWRFAPGTHHNEAVAMRVVIPFHFVFETGEPRFWR